MMRLDRSDVSSLAAIAVGGVVGLLGTGMFAEWVDDAQDRRVDVRVERVLDNQVRVRRERVQAALDASSTLSLRIGGKPSLDLPDRPAIYIDGVRIDADLLALEDLDTDAIESVTVVKQGAGSPSDTEVHIELKQR